MDMMLTQTFRNFKKNTPQKKKNLQKEQKNRKRLTEQKENKHTSIPIKMKLLMKLKKEARNTLDRPKFKTTIAKFYRKIHLLNSHNTSSEVISYVYCSYMFIAGTSICFHKYIDISRERNK